jgi:serine kinase of HPr protein (carbohydrate metabolism regulator)
MNHRALQQLFRASGRETAHHLPAGVTRENVSVIVEVAAMNMILKGVGYDAAEDFNSQLHAEIRKQTFLKKAQEHLDAPEND